MDNTAMPYTPADNRAAARMAFASLRGMKLSLARQLLSRIPDESTFLTAPSSQLSAMLGFTS
ncbi:MAG: hypothetical protein K2G95_05285, partial [Muribaculaceae bacterium]|nr:hypothetical protein [Muribaculaceae bacterium]